jgi:hypothetical protein
MPMFAAAEEEVACSAPRERRVLVPDRVATGPKFPLSGTGAAAVAVPCPFSIFRLFVGLTISSSSFSACPSASSCSCAYAEDDDFWLLRRRDFDVDEDGGWCKAEDISAPGKRAEELPDATCETDEEELDETNDVDDDVAGACDDFCPPLPEPRVAPRAAARDVGDG